MKSTKLTTIELIIMHDLMTVWARLLFRQPLFKASGLSKLSVLATQAHALLLFLVPSLNERRFLQIVT